MESLVNPKLVLAYARPEGGQLKERKDGVAFSCTVAFLPSHAPPAPHLRGLGFCDLGYYGFSYTWYVSRFAFAHDTLINQTLPITNTQTNGCQWFNQRVALRVLASSRRRHHFGLPNRPSDPNILSEPP